MRKIAFIVLSVLSITSTASETIEHFSEQELNAYVSGNIVALTKKQFETLNLGFTIDEYSESNLDRIMGSSIEKVEAKENLSSICYDASVNANIGLAQCLTGKITSYSQNYIKYKYTLRIQEDSSK